MTEAIIRYLRTQCANGYGPFCAFTVDAIAKGNNMSALYIDLFGTKTGRDMLAIYHKLRKMP